MPEKQSSRRINLEHIQQTNSTDSHTVRANTRQQPIKLQFDQHTHAGLWLDKYIAGLERSDTSALTTFI